jgi:hypothetical protein
MTLTQVIERNGATWRCDLPNRGAKHFFGPVIELAKRMRSRCNEKKDLPGAVWFPAIHTTNSH